MCRHYKWVLLNFWTETWRQSAWFEKKLWKQTRLEREMPECCKKNRSRKACTYCMFPFGSISQGHCGCFLMWFPLFIQHLLDNIGTDFQLCCHIGSRTMERATTTEVKRKKPQCCCTYSLDWISVCTVRHSRECWIHQSLVPSFGSSQHYLYLTLPWAHLLVYLAVVWLLTMKLS